MNVLSIEEFAVYNSLIRNLYESNNVEDLRVIITSALQKIVPFDSLAFFLVNPINNDFISTYHFNLPDLMFEDYKNNFEKFDLYKEKVFASSEIPPVDRASDYLDFEEWEKNIHRREFLIPNGCYYIACIQILANKTFIGEFSMHRNKDKVDFSDRDMLIFQALQPHICNAFIRSLNHNSPKSAVDLLLSAFDCQDKGILIMDDKLKVFYENELCSSILGKEKKYSVFINHIKAICTDIDKNIEVKSITNVPFSGKFVHKDLVVAFRTIPVSDNSTRLKYVYITTIEPLNLVSGTQKLKLILSDKEFLVAEHIAKGMTMKEIASTFHISIDTVKTHAKKIYLKAKCKSKTDLINNYF